MMENPTHGHGEALSAPRGIARRSFIAALSGAFGAAAVAGGAPAAAAAAIEAPSAEIAALLLAVETAETTYLTAVARRRAAWDEWAPQWPVPAESFRDDCAWPGTQERGLDGAPLVRDGRDSPYHLRTEENLQSLAAGYAAYVEDRLEKMATRPSHHQRRALALGRRNLAWANQALADRAAYDAECDRIRRASGFDALQTAKSRAAIELVRAVRRVLEAEGNAGADVAAKAAAVTSLAHLDRRDQYFVVGDDHLHGAVPLVILLARAVAPRELGPADCGTEAC